MFSLGHTVLSCRTTETRILLAPPPQPLVHLLIHSGTHYPFGLTQPDNCFFKAVILSQNEKKEMSEASYTHVDAASQFQLLQILMSLIHPWGRDTCADDALRDCCGFVKPQIEEVEDLQHPPPRLHSTTCLGLLSKHGCLAINFPGWSCLNPESVSGFSQLHSLNRFINAGLLLAELSLAETITSLSSTYLARLFEWRRYPVAGSTRHSLSNSDTDSHHLICNSWMHLAHRICTSLLASIVLPFNTTQPACICLPELEFFVHRWQDRSLPIRYAARTILLTLLDQMSPQVRKQVATYWTNLLPSFSLAQPTNQHRDTSVSIHPAAPSTVVNGDLTRPSDPHFHKPQPINKLNIPKDSSDSPLTRRFSIDPPASPERQVPRTSELPPSNDPLPITESVSLCSLDAVAGNSIPPVPDSHWWLTLNGYRISAREHARLQATAVVILAVIGSRYCSHVRHWHPAVFARDLTSDTGPSHIQAESGCNDDDNRTHGLAMPCFESPDSGCSTTTIRASNRLRLTLDQLSEVTALQPEVSGIFGFDDYRLARSVSQCLIALLLNRAPLLDGTSPHRDARPPSSISQPGFVPNRCGRLFNNTEATTLAHLMSNPNGSLRRAAIDLLGKGFVVWEPYSDLGQVINGLLSLVAGTETLLSSLPRWLPIPDHNDLVRTAREALWAITFARPKAITLNLSLEVRRSGSQLNAAASSAANATNRSESLSRSSSVSSGGLSSQVLHKNAAHRGSATTPALTEHRNPKMVVMLSSPAVATPIFTPSTGNVKNIPANYTGSESTSGLTNPCPPIFAAREEIVPLFEQLCARCASEIVSVLPEVVEVVLACLDRIRLKERGLEFLFPTFRQFSALSSHTRIHKVCVGGVNGSLTFFDFKLGRYLVTPGHKGPVTAVRFQADGRLVATYSLSEGLLRIWQLHTAGLFGMGGQQVKAISSHPVPPLQGPLKHASDASSSDADETSATHISTDRLSVWLDWPESRVVQIVTKRGVQRHINL
ncbi:unnamed protein product [Dicrocoelium dendriticum]|nr:unnamed protein product [Dicrocoelium dendriticum]